jgi:hypothetical protein
MDDKQNILHKKIDNIKNLIANTSELVVKNFIMGKKAPTEAVIIYISGLSNTDIIDRDILKPLMLYLDEDLSIIPNMENYLCKKYITLSNTNVETDINKTVEGIKRGKSVILIEGSNNFIMLNTVGGANRSITDPENETSVKGPRDGFVENLEINLSILQKRIKYKDLKTEEFVLGRKSQTDAVLMYIDDIVDKNLLKRIRDRITAIDVDNIQANSLIEQYIEKHSLSIFPQSLSTERPDRVQAKLMEGKIALLLEGTPFVVVFPTQFVEFFETVEDYYLRTIVASSTRMLRYLAAFITIALPAVYVTIIKFNAELIPSDFIKSIIESRKGIVLTPFMSILSMDLVVEFLREGGLRLPGKVGQTLSIVGGIIIGDAALKAKVVSSLTLLIVGISTTCTFLIPNYEMSLSVRLISLPVLIMADLLGAVGLSISLFFILAYLCSLDSYGVPYLSFKKSNILSDILRVPIWMLNKNSEITPNNNLVKQSNLKWRFRRKNNG